MTKNRESNVEVTLIDLSDECEKSLPKFQQHNPDIARIYHVGQFGFIETTDGLFALNDDGVGDTDPITDTNPLQIGICAEYNREGKKSFDAFPQWIVKLTPDDIRRFAGEKQNLADFIRTFGSRLQTNFEKWNDFLSRKGVAQCSM